jgi:hypothetical protein
MAPTTIILRRLHQQRLLHNPLTRPDEVVAWFGAVQAQEYALAKWALGLRIENATDTVVEQAFNAGTILRTHVMRPTWHFVASADIRWLLELTAPRVMQVNAHMYRQLELDDALFKDSNAIVAKALEGGRQLTRTELGDILAEAGINTSNGMRLGYILHQAELTGIICSGAKHGKQHTYALLEERAPHARKLARDEALAELTLRFFTSHGPATVKDFSWWSGLTMADAKNGLGMLTTQLTHEVIDDQTYWFSVSIPSVQIPRMMGQLLPVYDEYTIAYKNHSAILNPLYAEQATNRFFPSAFTVNGEIIGMWRRTFNKKSVVIETAPFRPFTPPESDAFATAAQDFGAFLGIPVVIFPDIL